MSVVRPTIPRLVSQFGRGRLMPSKTVGNSHRQMSTRPGNASSAPVSPAASPRLHNAVNMKCVPSAAVARGTARREKAVAASSQRVASRPLVQGPKPQFKPGRPPKQVDRGTKRKRKSNGRQQRSEKSAGPKLAGHGGEPPTSVASQPPLANLIAARQKDFNNVARHAATVDANRTVVVVSTLSARYQLAPKTRKIGESLSGCEAFDMFAEWFSEHGFVDAPPTSDVPCADRSTASAGQPLHRSQLHVRL